MTLPDKNVVARSLWRYRGTCNKTAPTVLPPLPAGINFDVPSRYREMVVRDVDADSDSRILILGEQNLRSIKKYGVQRYRRYRWQMGHSKNVPHYFCDESTCVELTV